MTKGETGPASKGGGFALLEGKAGPARGEGWAC